MGEPTNAVLSEQIKNNRRDFNEFKAEMREELKDLERRIMMTENMTQRIDQTIGFMSQTMTDIKTVVETFNDKTDKQNQKIDAFINSKDRRDSKKNLVVSIVQVVVGAVVALIGLFVTGKI
ncbi:hypothetical protein A374_08679 [Fictibacillus macauensis ZFHKF-1]|uniref:Uncharacterized protein n=1 Tax=Fictibacillus macauensis ZFHKF-1 TaxID=1196324 RepID=I8AJD0_9BACL|nr:hypothetical protein [Fictibacillus macauensis]EIT85897.1 hypothetical protein A374_08679 [Fictibacillus macauensis ZFHKF-1]